MIRFDGLCSRKAQWCKMILASMFIHLSDNKTIQHENNYRHFIIF
jgi:hypothetical protein